MLDWFRQLAINTRFHALTGVASAGSRLVPFSLRVTIAIVVTIRVSAVVFILLFFLFRLFSNDYGALPAIRRV